MTLRKIIGRAALSVFGVLLALATVETSMRMAASAIRKKTEHLSQIGSTRENGVLRVLCLGESTTAPWDDAQGDKSWPAQLYAILTKRYPRLRVEIINKGFFNTSSGAIVANLPNYLVLYHPQIVVSMMGVNDDQWYGIVKFDSGIRGWLKRRLAPFKTWKLLRYFYYSNFRSAQPALTRKARPSTAPPPTIVKECLQAAQNGALNQAEIISLCRRAMKSAPHDPRPYVALRRFYGRRHDLKNSYLEAVAAWKHGTRDPWLFMWLGNYFLYRAAHHYAEARLMFQKCADSSGETNDQIDPCMRGLATALARQGEYKAAAKAYLASAEDQSQTRFEDLKFIGTSQLKSADALPVTEADYRLHIHAYGVNVSWDAMPVTEANYRILWEILRGQRVALVAMQYPGWNISALKKMLPANQGIIFVSNKWLFDRALSREPYSAIFSDRFMGSWGHCTRKGNHIIAENLAGTFASLLTKNRFIQR